MSGAETVEPARQSRGWTIAYWAFQILFWGAYVAAGLSIQPVQVRTLPVVLFGYGLFFFYSIALTHGLRRFIRRRDWLGLSPGHAAWRVFLAAVLLGTIFAVLIVSVQAAWNRTSPFNVAVSFFVPMWANTVMASMVWTAIYTGTAALLRVRQARQNAIRLELDMREARLRALEAQIGPHFLFNCLNSVRGLILENPAEAQDMVTRLANILRHNLSRDSSPTETLGAQVEFTTDYVALEGIRFEERLRTRFAVDPATKTCAVPAMLLQTLVENAIKHGISHLPEGGEVAITAGFENGDLVITVENTGRLVPSPAGSTRVGLANLRERLRVLHGAKATLEVGETPTNTVRATVRIPWAK